MPYRLKRLDTLGDESSMNIRKAFSTVLATALVGTFTIASPVLADKADDNAPILAGNNDVTMLRGVDTWVSIALTAPVDLQDVRIVVEENRKGTEVSYAANGTSAGLNQGANLPQRGVDTASFKVSTSGDSPDKFDLDVIALWTEDGQSYREQIGELEIRLSEHDGEDYLFLTDSATIASTGDGAGNWIEMDFLGVAPLNSDLEIKVKKGLDVVYYPQEKFTSLHHDAWLASQEEDVARIWVDPDTVEPGQYTLEIEVKYTNNEGKNSKTQHTISVTAL